MIATLDELKLFMGIDVTDDSMDDKLNQILNGVEQAILNHDHVTSWNSASYTHEMHSGSGHDRLWLKNYPITAIISVSIGRLNAINIKNTDGDASATVNVSVSDANMKLTLVGGANAGDNDIAFSSYATLSAVVTQINTLGEGWSAEIVDSDLNGLASTELLQVDGMYVGSRRNRTASWTAIQITGDPLSGIRSDNETGEVYLSGGFPGGYQNIAFTYTAGYSTMPNDLVLAALRWSKIVDDRVEESGDGLASLSDGELQVKYLLEIPDVVLQTIDLPKYRRRDGIA